MSEIETMGPAPMFAAPKVSMIEGAWQRCPICLGRGHVMQGFYGSIQVEVFNSTGATEPCKSCCGRGIVR